MCGTPVLQDGPKGDDIGSRDSPWAMCPPGDGVKNEPTYLLAWGEIGSRIQTGG